MLSQLAKESLLVLVLTALLITLAATAGLPGRATPEHAEASGSNLIVTSPSGVLVCAGDDSCAESAFFPDMR